jgi:formate/nitrite transporter FocA (FNT family)
MADAGSRKATLPTKTVIVTGILSGMFLGFTTTLYLSAVVASGSALVGAIFFPVGFIMLVLLELELFTGNAALLPYARLAGRLTGGQ